MRAEPALRSHLIDSAVDATTTIPGGWKRRGDRLVGSLEGRHGRYAISISDDEGGHELAVEVVLPDSVGSAPIPLLAAACLQANGDWLGPGLQVSRQLNGSVVAAASIWISRFTGELEPVLIRNLLARCLERAALIPALVAAVAGGASPVEAPGRVSDPRMLSHGGSLLRPPLTDPELVELCLAAADASGWLSRRYDESAVSIAESETLGMAVRVCAGRISAWSGGFDENERVPTERVLGTSEKFNLLVDEQLSAVVTLDLEQGMFGSRSFLDTAGMTEAPHVDLVRDVIAQASAGWVAGRAVLQDIAERA